MAVFAAAYRDHTDPEELLAAWGLTGQHERLGCRVARRDHRHRRQSRPNSGSPWATCYRTGSGHQIDSIRQIFTDPTLAVPPSAKSCTRSLLAPGNT